MLERFAGRIWKVLPYRGRLLIVRLTQRKFTVSVVAAVFNEEGKLLVLDHYVRPGADWGLPGGFIEPGENPVDAVRRELSEETGLELNGVRLLDISTIGRHIEVLFLASSAGTARVNSSEIRALGWFGPDELPQKMNKRQRRIAFRLFEIHSRENGKDGPPFSTDSS